MDVLELLHLKLSLAAPSMHIPTLRAHCEAVLKGSTTFPNDLHAKLKAVLPHLHSVSQCADSLSTMLSRSNILQNLPTPPTACATFILAIEAEIASSLPHAGAFAQNLGARMGVSQKVVMERYKIIYDTVEALIHEVPWLERHEKRSGRSKITKRAVVARGLKDVVQFQEQIWSQRIERLHKPALSLESDEASNESESHDSFDSSIDEPITDLPDDQHRIPSDTPKTRTLYQRAIGRASQFLLSPTSHSPTLPRKRQPHFDDDTLIHLLTVDTPSLTHVCHTAPTRLQSISLKRGGEDTIDDEELFEEGELEGFIRSEEEVNILRETFGWEEVKDHSVDQPHPLSGDSRKRRSSCDDDPSDAPPRRKQRIDMDALAHILDPNNHLSDNLVPDEEETNPGTSALAFTGEDEVVSDWRPLSPGHSSFDYDRYDC